MQLLRKFIKPVCVFKKRFQASKQHFRQANTFLRNRTKGPLFMQLLIKKFIKLQCVQPKARSDLKKQFISILVNFLEIFV